ncbi:hypothetical protein OsJ_34682 [Oryza sativa Japonica Group]|uniref:KIB1-4 beta-propeller domain-containing protein n=1 Tax=Oryza sativa subsp. japonica TaxID=39947 RepID=A3CDI5_ORYSJ|nr:hypothetical protein OsJ_34682 [Oryza sativa Japonica Group]
MDDDKLALAVAHVAFPDGDLFTFPDLEPHGAGAGGEGGTAGYLAACGDRLLLADDEYGVLRLTSPLTGDTVVLPGLVIGGGVSVRDVPVVLADESSPSGTATAAVEGQRGDVRAEAGRARDRWRWYDDMAFHGGRLYALTQAEDLLAFDVVDAGDGEPVVTGVERVVRSSVDALDVEDTRMHYLVTSLDGALLMVRREMADAGSTDGFEVFEADLAASRWVEVGGLGAGGEALFVGRLCSRAVRAPDDGDQIFFLDDTDGLSFRWELQPRPPYQVAAYDMVRRTFSMLMWKKPLEDGNTPVTWLFPDDDDDDDRVTK